AMFMLPLYYQVVRGQSALHAGLLLAPQGLGAAIMMPIAGKRTDDVGAGKIVLGGLAFLFLGMLGYTQVGANTSFWFLGGCQLFMGFGMGASMMPAMSAAYQTLQRNQLARATTALNIIQRVGGSIGTALLAVVLTHQLTSRLPSNAEGGLAAAQSVPAADRARVAPDIAEAFGHTFWWAAGIIALAVIPALLLPRHKPEPPEAPAPGEPAADDVPMLIEV
ncbi:MAG TPA: MFS transporter, partial [Baekduia sp.]